MSLSARCCATSTIDHLPGFSGWRMTSSDNPSKKSRRADTWSPRTSRGSRLPSRFSSPWAYSPGLSTGTEGSLTAIANLLCQSSCHGSLAQTADQLYHDPANTEQPLGERRHHARGLLRFLVPSRDDGPCRALLP